MPDNARSKIAPRGTRIAQEDDTAHVDWSVLEASLLITEDGEEVLTEGGETILVEA